MLMNLMCAINGSGELQKREGAKGLTIYGFLFSFPFFGSLTLIYKAEWSNANFSFYKE